MKTHDIKKCKISDFRIGDKLSENGKALDSIVLDSTYATPSSFDGGKSISIIQQKTIGMPEIVLLSLEEFRTIRNWLRSKNIEI